MANEKDKKVMSGEVKESYERGYNDGYYEALIDINKLTNNAYKQWKSEKEIRTSDHIWDEIISMYEELMTINKIKVNWYN